MYSLLGRKAQGMGRKKATVEQERVVKELKAAKKQRDLMERKYLDSISELDRVMFDAHREHGLSIVAIHEAVNMTRVSVYGGIQRHEESLKGEI